MSDRSDEVTESRDTEDLLEETENLLSESGAGAEPGAGTPSTPADRPASDREPPTVDESTGREPSGDDSWWSSADSRSGTDADSGAGTDADSRTGSLRSRLTPGLSPQKYFSPRAFLAFVLLVGAGLFAGGLVIPIAGRIVGMFGVAFAVGLLSSKRRYLEMGAAGTAVGGVSAVVSNAVIAFAGSVRAVVAVGVAAGLVGCLLGYYFGRDLRNGLSQDIE
ncbi:DUF456 domain-containing protein [Haloterrigena alkaliphila]|uniref:DUF456 domain-containing protein n=1 Tax=Haloterrigena alkaliphila TaxID=2816475 RepID=A0A8A2V8P5_9EURY|nr:DUF456 domain-containing protein [Haloterrigena alkaliphila]QSW97811.1 DUF456 domain-containing protein [Haloterrigena alkaliphila]